MGIEWARDRQWLRGRDLIVPAGAMALGVIVWLVPAVIESGDWSSYAAATRSAALGNIWSKSIFVAGIAVTAERFTALATDLWVSVGLLLGLPIVAVIARLRSHPSAALRRLDTLLIGAAISFFFYGLLIYDSSGYVMSCVLPLIAYGFLAVAELAVAARVPIGIQTRLAAGLLIGAMTLAVFPLGPDDPGAHGRFAIHDRQLARRFALVRRRFTPASTLLVTSREYWAYGLRHIAYYLPEYPILQLVRDPFITGLSEETPYLTGQSGRVWGTSGVELADLVPRGDSDGLRWLVYMVPHDAVEFIAPSCRPHVRGLDIGEQERLAVIELSAEQWVRVVDERLVCSPRVAGGE